MVERKTSKMICASTLNPYGINNDHAKLLLHINSIYDD